MDSFGFIGSTWIHLRTLMQDMTKDKLLENSGNVCRLCDCHKKVAQT